MLRALTIPLQIVLQLTAPNDLETRNISSGELSLITDTSLPEYTPSILDGWTIFPDLGVAYQYQSYTRTWNMARKDCAARGANLAVIDSFRKMDEVVKMTKNETSLWVGIHRLFDDVEWVSLKTGSPPATIPWAPNEPESEKLDQKCVGAWYDGRGLFSYTCNKPRRFVCEIEL